MFAWTLHTNSYKCIVRNGGGRVMYVLNPARQQLLCCVQVSPLLLVAAWVTLVLLFRCL
jgi:hypothetical protein